MKYNFHPAALTEYSEAVQFYSEKNIELAQNFINSFEDAIFRIIESPNRYPVTAEDIRRCLVRKFPYAILYSIEDEYILIIAVMHYSQKPEYWQERIK
ncbi:type II toxin-antitoxin system RelE/ParE family toxin [Sphaerospermopsis aphanizomenoides BCCUSP55]|uniref:type II toxin-antitoxin system RelE/ParE family toxin n=1 Tax=Sphaerospermopsis aphanizomenoides TaxID=459663 RepID=UPI001907D85D|nr:type II toxin-antitoxin system RelE/ParE family toxin [Sphaerospermopsis aphanizomenoides]MBK1989661.1 type II toxin-antitoxin system RelE/ParE family toxin [Sphaerospermopsis aphanizomenoides BCCUSP55]